MLNARSRFIVQVSCLICLLVVGYSLLYIATPKDIAAKTMEFKDSFKATETLYSIVTMTQHETATVTHTSTVSVAKAWPTFERPDMKFDDANRFRIQDDRYDTVEVWRPDDVYESAKANSAENEVLRYDQPARANFISDKEYLKMPLMKDYVTKRDLNSSEIFLMIKTGANVMWRRLPAHIWGTLPKFPTFALYSDAPGSLAGYEIIDILRNVSEPIKERDEFKLYHAQLKNHDKRGNRLSHEVSSGSEANDQAAWELDRYKNVPMLQHAWDTNPNCKWYVFIDADTSIFADSLVDYLSTVDHTHPWLIGSNANTAPNDFAHGGSGVAISRTAMERSFGVEAARSSHYEELARDWCCGDAVASQLIKDLNKISVHHYGGFQGNPWHAVTFWPSMYCDRLITLHHVAASDVERMYQYERLRKHRPWTDQPFTYGELYEQFWMPFLAEEMENWDNFAHEEHSYREQTEAQGLVAKVDGGEAELAWESKDACKAWCRAKEDCHAWKWSPNSCYRSYPFALGVAVTDWLREDTVVVSGFMLDRLRGLRESAECRSTIEEGSSIAEGCYWSKTCGEPVNPPPVLSP